jgi:Usg-like family
MAATWRPCSGVFFRKGLSTHSGRGPTISENAIESLTTGTSGTASLPERFNAGRSVRGGRGRPRKTAGKQSSNQKRWSDGFGGFSQIGSWLRADDRAHSIPGPIIAGCCSPIWQNYDLFPEFPELHRFLAFWQEKLEGPLHSVRVAHCKLIKPAELKAVDGEFRLH